MISIRFFVDEDKIHLAEVWSFDDKTNFWTGRNVFSLNKDDKQIKRSEYFSSLHFKPGDEGYCFVEISESELEELQHICTIAYRAIGRFLHQPHKKRHQLKMDRIDVIAYSVQYLSDFKNVKELEVEEIIDFGEKVCNKVDSIMKDKGFACFFVPDNDSNVVEFKSCKK